MKRIIVATILIVAASSYVQGQSKDRQSKDIQPELMRLQRAQFEAEDKKDIAALDRLLSDGFFFTQPNGVVSDKQKFIEGVKSDEPETDQILNYDEVKTHAYGKFAVVSYLLIVKGHDKDGKDNTSRYRNTAVWVKQQGRWRMAAIHASRVRP